jgi:hypothetical protein
LTIARLLLWIVRHRWLTHSSALLRVGLLRIRRTLGRSRVAGWRLGVLLLLSIGLLWIAGLRLPERGSLGGWSGGAKRGLPYRVLRVNI